jgi:hypothetical protein
MTASSVPFRFVIWHDPLSNALITSMRIRHRAFWSLLCRHDARSC